MSSVMRATPVPLTWAIDMGADTAKTLGYQVEVVYLRGLECLGQLVLQFALRVDGEDAHDGNAHGTIGPHILQDTRLDIRLRYRWWWGFLTLIRLP